MRQRHALYFLSLAEEAEKQLGTQAQETWFSKLQADHDNLRAALRWSITDGEAEVGLRLATSLWQFWRAQGHLAEDVSGWRRRLAPRRRPRPSFEPRRYGGLRGWLSPKMTCGRLGDTARNCWN
jgi:predicted ATPase